MSDIQTKANYSPKPKNKCHCSNNNILVQQLTLRDVRDGYFASRGGLVGYFQNLATLDGLSNITNPSEIMGLKNLNMNTRLKNYKTLTFLIKEAIISDT